MTINTSHNLKSIGEQIRYYRKLKGLSQKELAKKLNVTWETVSRWENGRVSPIHKLGQIADILSIPVSYLLNLQDPQTNYGKNNNTIPYVGQLPKNPKELEKAYKATLFTLQLENFVPDGSFAIKVNKNLANTTPIPLDTNTILIINPNIQLDTNYTLLYNTTIDKFVLAITKNKKALQNNLPVARVIAILLL